jgi:hypothetical protein
MIFFQIFLKGFYSNFGSIKFRPPWSSTSKCPHSSPKSFLFARKGRSWTAPRASILRPIIGYLGEEHWRHVPRNIAGSYWGSGHFLSRLTFAGDKPGQMYGLLISPGGTGRLVQSIRSKRSDQTNGCKIISRPFHGSEETTLLSQLPLPSSERYHG